MKKNEVVQSEEWKYKSYQSLEKWYDVNSLVIDTPFIFTRYTLISPANNKIKQYINSFKAGRDMPYIVYA